MNLANDVRTGLPALAETVAHRDIRGDWILVDARNGGAEIFDVARTGSGRLRVIPGSLETAQHAAAIVLIQDDEIPVEPVLRLLGDTGRPRILVRKVADRFQEATTDGTTSFVRRGCRTQWNIVFDRTRLDTTQWARALDAVAQGTCNVDPSLPDSDPSLWNRDCIESTARTLSNLLARHAPESTIEVWGFSDVPRPDGCAPVAGLPMERIPFNRLGRCDREGLATAFAGLSYVTGLDLCDAVDEALADVLSSVRHHPGIRHAVLVIGDSPPPAYGPDDPIWKEVAARPGTPFTGMRCSTLFRDTLEDLGKLGVPVGWLFLADRGAPPPGADATYLTWRDQTARVLDPRPSLSAPSPGAAPGPAPLSG